MTDEQKKILLADLCARLPYGVKGLRSYNDKEIVTLNGILPDCKYTSYGATYTFIELQFSNKDCCTINKFKPYLRPMSSMTEKERDWYRAKCSAIKESEIRYVTHIKELVDFFNSHHLDWRGLIPMGLALEAKEGMYNIK